MGSSSGQQGPLQGQQGQQQGQQSQLEAMGTTIAHKKAAIISRSSNIVHQYHHGLCSVVLYIMELHVSPTMEFKHLEYADR